MILIAADGGHLVDFRNLAQAVCLQLTFVADTTVGDEGVRCFVVWASAQPKRSPM